MRIRRFLAAAAAALSVIAGLPQNVSAGPALMPGVTEEMTKASFWVNGGDEVLADTASLKTLNQAIIGTKECRMTDLSSASETFDGSLYLLSYSSSLHPLKARNIEANKAVYINIFFIFYSLLMRLCY